VNEGSITGGAGGGVGGNGGIGTNLTNTELVNNDTIRGGDATTGSGGMGVQVGRSSTLINYGTIEGGNSSSGIGGWGVNMGSPPLPSGPQNTVTNYGTIRGGNGSIVGGEGLVVRPGTGQVINEGTIEGGNGANAIAVGGVGTPTLNLVNSGTIRAGAGQDTAIALGLATATIMLELRAGSEIIGDIVGNATASDSLILGGDEDDTFDASAIGTQYQNFNIFEKTGDSTWTLTGTTTALTPWQILGGTLAVSSDGALGDAAGAVTFDLGTLRALTSFETSRTMNFANMGGIEVDAGAVLTVNGALSGPGGLVMFGQGTLLQNSVTGYALGTGVFGGTLQAGAAGVFAGNYSTDGGGVLDLGGFDQTIANLINAGQVRLGGAPGTTLTVTGDYLGVGGIVELNAALGDDNSVTDLLDVLGNTMDTSYLVVNNVGGGGAQTVNGIKVINVEGTSDGTFSLLGDYLFEGEQAVVGGAFAYRLYQGTPTDADGDWYLRSELDNSLLFQAGVPVYEAYPGVLQSFNQLGTLQQRLGNRSWTVVAQGADAISEEAAVSPGIGLWGQIEGGYGEFQPETSTTATDYDVSIWRLKAGVDTVLSEGANGQLIGGLAVQYGTASSDISSIFGDGSIDATGYGASGSLTWYGNTGFYADAQAQIIGYDSDLTSDTAGVGLVEGNDGVGYSLGVELGQRIPVTPEWAITPQAQLAWSSVDFDDFEDAFGAEVSLDSGDSLIGRLGLAVDRQTEWLAADGSTRRTHLYGIGNLYYDFEDGTSVDVAGTPVDSEVDALWGGLGLGGTYAWANDKYALYGEASAKSQLEDFGDSYAISGTVGFKATW
jgi:fibronectin-binding autotransporter adhesin